jgi:hypothetical protein
VFADVEALLVGYLTPIPGVVGVSVELPHAALSMLPFVLVTRVSGGDNYITDSATVDVECFHSSRFLASEIARTVHAAMMLLRHTAVAGVLVDYVETITGPQWIDYDDENLQRYLASYLIESRVCAVP